MPRSLRIAGALGALLRDAMKRYSADNVPRLAAALAYYSLFSIAPAVLVAVFIAGLIVGPTAAQSQLQSVFVVYGGPIIASAVDSLMAATKYTATGTTAAGISLVALAFGGSGIFLELRESLDVILGGRKPSHPSLLRIIKTRSLAFGMVFAGSLVLLGGMAASAVLQGLLREIQPLVPVAAPLLGAADTAALLAISLLIFGLLYREIPRPRPAWKRAWTGAAIAAVLFVAGELLASIYIGRAAPASTVGAVGSILVLSIWVYYSAQIVYFGAEVARCCESRPGVDATTLSP